VNPPRSLSFGDDSEAYDRARPSYPPELVDDLAPEGGLDILDVGCGTGKLGRLLAARGCRVLGVEPDERMAAMARSHGLAVEVSPFEPWDDAGRRVDLVASAQAWHWIDQGAGARKAAEVLRPGGRLAVIWNLYRHEPAMKGTLEAVYERHAPELVGGTVLGLEDGGLPLAGVDETGAFEPQERRTFAWEQRCSTAEWIDQLPTHSDHRALPASRRADLLAAVADALDAAGGGLTVGYTTLLITARRS
jgi:SAM-dependent methyltransferase